MCSGNMRYVGVHKNKGTTIVSLAKQLSATKFGLHSYMASLILLFTILACSLLPHIFCQRFDFFYFVQQWPGSYCDTKQKCCYPITGKPASDFSIHGLWPNYNDGSYPSSCPGSSYDASLISDLKEQLQTYWDTLACPSGDGEKFWLHEWEKHGTCSGLDERSYFLRTLGLRQSVDILSALQNAGIEADDGNYSVSEIEEAVKQAIGHKPRLECNRGSSGKRQLYQVYVCVDTDAATLIECPTFPSSSCPSRVTFPSF